MAWAVSVVRYVTVSVCVGDDVQLDWIDDDVTADETSDWLRDGCWPHAPEHAGALNALHACGGVWQRDSDQCDGGRR
jgi:hypothetical protein